MSYNLSPVLNEQQFDANGDPRAGALITTYLAGTLTLVTTYKTSTGTAHTNPIQLDSSGNYPNGTQLWLLGGLTYKFVITDSDGSNSRTYDNISGIGDSTTITDPWILYGAAPTYINATSFSVVGDQTNLFPPRTAIKSNNTGGTIYSTVQTSTYSAPNTTVTVVNNAGVLDTGLDAVYYSIINAVNAPLPGIPTGTISGRTTAGIGPTENLTIVGATMAAGVITVTPSSVIYYRNWRADSTGVNNYNVVCTADEVTLRNTAGLSVLQSTVSKTINANGVVGAPLSIMSARVASTWYYIWLWYNASLGLTATLDISSTAPTAPTGYVAGDYKALMPGARRTDATGSTYLLCMATRNDETRYVVTAGSNTAVTPRMSSGAIGTGPSTYAVIATGAFVPPAATVMYGDVGNPFVSSTFLLAPSAAYGAIGATNPPPIWQNVGASDFSHESFELELLSTNIYYIALSGGYLNCRGWKENL